MADSLRNTRAPLMLPFTVLHGVLQELARSWHQFQVYTNNLQQENRHLRDGNYSLLQQLDVLRESQTRQETEIQRQNAVISILEASTNQNSRAQSQQLEPPDTGPNYTLSSTRLPENYAYEGLEVLEEMGEDRYSIRKRLKRQAEDESAVDNEE